MKHQIAKILVNVLRALKVSVIIGFEVDNIKSKYDITFIYDNTLNGVMKDNEGLEIPFMKGYFYRCYKKGGK